MDLHVIYTMYYFFPRVEVTRVVELAMEVSEAFGMQLGLKKCAQAHFKEGGKALVGRRASRTKTLVDGESYKYLGAEQLWE